MYSRGLDVRVSSWDRIVEQTDGASAAFIRELMRRATLLAVDETNGAVVRDAHVGGALHALAFEGGTLTRSLLGARLTVVSEQER